MNEDAEWGTTMNEALAGAHLRSVDLAALAGTEGPKRDRAETVYDEAVAGGLSQVEAAYRVIAMLHAEFPDLEEAAHRLPPGTTTRTEYTTLHPTRPPTPSNRRGPHHTHQRHIHTTPWTPLNNNPTDQLRP